MIRKAIRALILWAMDGAWPRHEVTIEISGRRLLYELERASRRLG